MTVVSVVAAVGSNWKDLALTCHFSATADQAPLAVADDTKPVWLIPATASEFTITATPDVPTYWPTTVKFTVDPATGALTPTDNGGFVTIKTLGVPGVVELSWLTVNLSRFKDDSDTVRGQLGKPPATRADRNTMYSKVYSRHWPPQNWDLDDQPDARFLDLPVPDQGVSFSKDANLHVDAETVVLRLAGVVAPKLWAVSWPQNVDRTEGADPTPILLFLRQGNQQYKGDLFSGPGLDPYPYNFDYSSFGLYDDLAYVDGDLFRWPFSLGVPYQVAKAGNKAVTVHPVNSLDEDFGVIESTKQMGRILLELQSFMFRRAGVTTPPKTIGTTAIASFSSGTHILARILSSADNAGEPFLNDTVHAVYFLDPPWWAVKDCVVAALAWAKTPSPDKRVRFYTQTDWPVLAALKKKIDLPLPKEPYVKTSTDTLVTHGFVSRTSWSTLVNQVTQPFTGDDWQFAHFATAATMLTHAMTQDF